MITLHLRRYAAIYCVHIFLLSFFRFDSCVGVENFLIGTRALIVGVHNALNKVLNMTRDPFMLLADGVLYALDAVMQKAVALRELVDDPDAVLYRGVRAVAELLADVGKRVVG